MLDCILHGQAEAGVTEVRSGRWCKESHQDLEIGVQGVEALP